MITSYASTVPDSGSINRPARTTVTCATADWTSVNANTKTIAFKSPPHTPPLPAPAHSSNPPPAADETNVPPLHAAPKAGPLRKPATSALSAPLHKSPNPHPGPDFPPLHSARCKGAQPRSRRQSRNQTRPGSDPHQSKSPDSYPDTPRRS